jgi:cell division septation protein DedD
MAILIKKGFLMLSLLIIANNILFAQTKQKDSTKVNFRTKVLYNKQVIGHLNLPKSEKKGNKYIVQIGIFQNVRNVEWLVQAIQRKYDYTLKVFTENKKNGPIHTVYFGEFDTKEEAIEANKSLAKMHRKGIVKKF